MTNEVHENKAVHSIIPAVNIVETPKSYIVTLDIPGVAKEHIKANIENNTLSVTADVADDSESENTEAKQYRREFSLANNIDVYTIDAQYQLGVLTVTLNKKEQFLPKQIAIN